MSDEQHSGGEQPASEPAAPQQPATQDLELEWRRLHPLSPLLRGGLALLVIAGILIANMRDRIIDLFIAERYQEEFGDSGDLIDLVDFLAKERLLLWALIGLLVVILLIVGISWLMWRYARFRITGDAVESRRGVVFKQHRRAPLERIQSVNLQRSLLARLLGLTQLDVQTGGQGGTVALQYLGHKDAKQVREQILRASAATKAPAPQAPSGFAAASGAGAGAGAVIGAAPGVAPGAFVDANGNPVDANGNPVAATGVVAPDPYAQGAYDAATGAPHGTEPVAGGVAVDFAGRVYATHAGALDEHFRQIADFDIDPSARETGSLIKVPIGRLTASILLSSEMLITIVLIAGVLVSSIWLSPATLFGAVPLVLVLISLLIGQFNKGFNFVLSRSIDGIRVGAGLTATTTETVPFGRIHAVEALQPLGWRPFGWWKVRITTAGYSLSQAGQNKLQNSVLPVGKIDDVLRVFETVLHSHDEGTEARGIVLREALIGDGRGFLRAGRRAGWVLWFGKRRAGLRIEDAATDQATLRIRRGAVTRRLIDMPLLRAQSIQLHRPFVHRLLGLASITAHTVLGPVQVRMSGIALGDAQQVFDVLSSTIVRVQSADAERRAAAYETGEPR